ncbi:MAG: DHA2 family efflux MFS transporter permease subunit, partial [bacterium]
MSEAIAPKVKIDRWQWIVLLTVIVGTFLGRLDQTIVNLAMPKIMDDFGITISAAGWIGTAYIIANAIFVPIWGKLGDLLGRKKIYIIGFSIFILGSVLCGFAWNLSSMIIFRIIQAIASSADYPTAMAIIAVTFHDGKQRAQALGVWSASFMAASVFGPLIGGPLIDNFGWPAVFFINLPIGIAGVIMAILFIHESRDSNLKMRFDWLGAVLLGGALSSLVLVLEKGLSWGWTSVSSLICYLLIVTLFAGFIYQEKRAPDPMIDLKFFKIPVFNNALVNNFVVFMGMIGAVFLVPLFAQNFLGYDATQTGLLFMPMAFVMMIAAPIGGSLVGKVKPNKVIFFSSLVAAIGIYLFTFLEAKSGPLAIIIPVMVMAGGMGFGMAQRTNLVSSAVPVREVGSASAVLALVRNIAGAFGIAIFSTTLDTATKNHAMDLIRYSSIQV